MSLQIKDSKYITVFDPENKGNYVQANLSTGKKDKDGNWTNMNWLGARFVGKAKEQAGKLNSKDRIEIKSGLVENVYKKDTKQTFINVVIFEFEFMEKKIKNDNSDAGLEQFQSMDDDDLLPF